jgi:ABC-type multidrug transport system ATPase subunit
VANVQNPIIQFNHVSRRFGSRNVLTDIDLQVPAGTIAGLVGPNGSGKTTLLKLMAGFIKATSGDVRLFCLPPILAIGAASFVSKSFGLICCGTVPNCWPLPLHFFR